MRAYKMGNMSGLIAPIGLFSDIEKHTEKKNAAIHVVTAEANMRTYSLK
jgi:hypothetical protein